MLNLCYRFVHNREDAEDVTQEVFVQVYCSLENFRGDAKISTWIYRIAVSKSLDFLRRKKRKKRFGIIQRLFDEDATDQEFPLPVFDNPHTELEQKDRARILKWAVNSLPENQRIAISLNKYEGFSYQEVAEIMETSLSSVESLLFRAKKNLEKKLQKYYDDVM